MPKAHARRSPSSSRSALALCGCVLWVTTSLARPTLRGTPARPLAACPAAFRGLRAVAAIFLLEPALAVSNATRASARLATAPFGCPAWCRGTFAPRYVGTTPSCAPCNLKEADIARARRRLQAHTPYSTSVLNPGSDGQPYDKFGALAPLCAATLHCCSRRVGCTCSLTWPKTPPPTIHGRAKRRRVRRHHRRRRVW